MGDPLWVHRDPLDGGPVTELEMLKTLAPQVAGRQFSRLVLPAPNLPPAPDSGRVHLWGLPGVRQALMWDGQRLTVAVCAGTGGDCLPSSGVTLGTVPDPGGWLAPTRSRTHTVMVCGPCEWGALQRLESFDMKQGHGLYLPADVLELLYRHPREGWHSLRLRAGRTSTHVMIEPGLVPFIRAAEVLSELDDDRIQRRIDGLPGQAVKDHSGIRLIYARHPQRQVGIRVTSSRRFNRSRVIGHLGVVAGGCQALCSVASDATASQDFMELIAFVQEDAPLLLTDGRRWRLDWRGDLTGPTF